jgi:ethanolaminephosphotransferase
MVYIRQDKLPKLKEYKYSSVDHSLVSRYVLKPFYTHFVIKCFPMWMAYVSLPIPFAIQPADARGSR